MIPAATHAPSEEASAAAERRWQRRPDERREELIAAAAEVFGDVGFAAAKCEDLARRAGVSKGTIYLYFSDKEDLFRAMVQTVVAGPLHAVFADSSAADTTAPEQLTRYLAGLWRLLRDPRNARVARLIHAEIPRFPDLARFYVDQVIAPARQRMHELIARGVARGEFRAPDTDLVGRLLALLTVHASLYQSFFAPHDAGAGTDDEMLGAVLEIAHRALAPERSA